MDYGDRQKRAELLVKWFRADGDKVVNPNTGETGNELAQHIEDQTERGKEVVAVAGFVFQAVARDPNLVQSIQGRKSKTTR